MTLHQRGHVTVACAPEQIAFPMTGNGSVFYFRRSLADRNGVDDLALGVSVNAGVPRAADTPFRAQVLNQLLFQHSTRLYEQAAINRFVGHLHRLVLGILALQPSGNLLRRPVQKEFTRNDLPELSVSG